MTVSALYAWNPDGTAIVRQGMRLAGVLAHDAEPSSTDVQAGLEIVNGLLKAWQAGDRLLRNVEKNVTQTLTSGTASYSITDDTMDVEFPATIVLASSTTTENVVERMTLDEYTAISNKSQTGVPTRLLVERAATVILTLWPVPDATVSSLKYTRARLVRDMTSTTTLDVQQRYVRTVILGLAVELAEMSNKGDDKIMRLERRYDLAKQDLTADNSERGDVTFAMGRW
jgi:hypothetical protein